MFTRTRIMLALDHTITGEARAERMTPIGRQLLVAFDSGARRWLDEGDLLREVVAHPRASLDDRTFRMAMLETMAMVEAQCGVIS